MNKKEQTLPTAETVVTKTTEKGKNKRTLKAGILLLLVLLAGFLFFSGWFSSKQTLTNQQSTPPAIEDAQSLEQTERQQQQDIKQKSENIKKNLF